MRPIDADGLLKKYEWLNWYSVSEKGHLMKGATSESNSLIYYHDGEELIKNAPTLDVVPTVDADPKWINVEDRLPENGQVVLCWYEYFRFGNYNQIYRTYGIGYYFHGNWGGEVVQGQQSKVLVWMPMPQPPKGE